MMKKKILTILILCFAVMGYGHDLLAASAVLASPKTQDIKSLNQVKDIKSLNQVKCVFPDIQAILDEGVLRVAVLKEDRIPFFFVNKEGELSGIDIEFATLIAKNLGVRVEFIRTAPDFNAVVDQVSRGEAHMGASKLSYTNERARKVIYADHPYITLHVSLLINRSQLESFPAGISIEEIFKKSKVKIAVQKGSSQIEAVQRMFPQAHLVQLDTIEEINAQVLKGDCFARMSDDSELTRLLLQNPEYNIMCSIVAFTQEEDNIYLVVNHHFPTLVKFVHLIEKNKLKSKLDLQSVFKRYEGDIKLS